MTFIAVSIFVQGPDDVSGALERAETAVAQGARLVEWRIDALAEEPDPIGIVSRLVADSPAPCIVTCRPTWEGGAYGGDEATRVSLFEALATSDAPARYIDVELAAYDRSANFRQKVDLAVAHPAQVRGLQTSLILSSHEFEGRPADLLRRVEAMLRHPACTVIKLAWRARSLRDNLEVFDLLRERGKPMIALCMGEFGLMSRVLAPKFGALLTFATDVAGSETAPGQPTIDELRGLYGFDRIGAATRVYGIVGWPVGHSRSPRIHNEGFRIVGHDGVYLPLPVPPEYEHFKATIGSLIDHEHLDFRGASVTIPHKVNLVRFVAERGGVVEESAARCGAANTLVIDDDHTLRCTNTDGAAARAALGAPFAGERVTGRVAILGAGGAARAVIAELSAAGAEVIVFNRTRQRAEEVIAACCAQVPEASISIAGDDAAQHFDAVINCTPVGMEGGPDPTGNPLPAVIELDEGTRVLDTVYAPRRTALLVHAEECGALAIGGAEMFARQAAAQFERWTGVAAPWDASGA